MQLCIGNPDFYDTATMDRYFSVVSVNAIVSPGDGLGGTGALSASADDEYVIDDRFVVADPLGRFRLGRRLWIDSLPATEQILLAATDGNRDILCCMTLNPDGTINVRRGDIATGTILGPPSIQTITTGVFHRIGFKGIASHSGGELEAHLDSATGALNRVCFVTGVDSAATDLAWKGIYIGLFTNSFASMWYANDGSGVVNDLIHGFYTAYSFITAATVDQWDKSSGTMESVLDDAVPNDDTDYIFTNAFLVEYLGTLTFSASERVYGFQVSAMVRNLPDTGYTPSHELRVNVDGVTYVAPSQSVTDSEWREIRKMWDRRPSDNLPWDFASVSAAAAGGRVTP